MKTTRREFLQIFGIGAITAAAMSLAGCGGSGGGSSSDPRMLKITATKEGSVLDACQSYMVSTLYDEDYDDYILTQVGPLVGKLVFEINGQRVDTPSTSAARTTVKPGDIITWKIVG